MVCLVFGKLRLIGEGYAYPVWNVMARFGGASHDPPSRTKRRFPNVIKKKPGPIARQIFGSKRPDQRAPTPVLMK